MRNKIMFFICIFISFGFISNAKALTLNMSYNSSYVNQILSNSPISEINSKLIPFIEENMDDYYVSIMPQFNPYGSGTSRIGLRINIFQKLDNKIPAFRIYLGSSGTNYISLLQVDSINGNAYNTGQYSFNFRNNFYPNPNIDTIINGLTNFISNPNWEGSTLTGRLTEIDNVISNNQVKFLYNAIYAREGLPYYANFDARIIRSTGTYESGFADLIVNYDEQDFEYGFNSLFPFYKDFITANTYLPPTASDLGDGQFGYTANQIVINDIQSVSPVKCPQNTDFINDFCYTNQHNYIDEEHLLNGALNVQFDLMNRPRFTQDNYYILTYRVHSSVNYLPNVASISSGQTSMPIQIIKTNIVNNGIYKDIQVVLKATQSFGNNEPYALSTISLRFPTISTSEPDTSDFYYGIYKTYKFTVSGTEPPTQTQLDNDYHNNDIDSVSNNDNNTSWFNKFHINDRGLSTILTAPVTLFQRMRNTTCTNIVVPIPYLGNFSLPCISAIFSENLPTVFNLYQTIISGIICYYVGLGYFRIIKNAFTPDNDRIEVQDL